uniref:Uncharacterized protein n=1 Tax=Arundo donax TaxID=35708 RepID=A0A0A8XTH6_ARUDO
MKQLPGYAAPDDIPQPMISMYNSHCPVPLPIPISCRS